MRMTVKHITMIVIHKPEIFSPGPFRRQQPEKLLAIIGIIKVFRILYI